MPEYLRLQLSEWKNVVSNIILSDDLLLFFPDFFFPKVYFPKSCEFSPLSSTVFFTV